MSPSLQKQKSLRITLFTSHKVKEYLTPTLTPWHGNPLLTESDPVITLDYFNIQMSRYKLKLL